MPFYLLHIGTALWKLSTLGNLTSVSLPTSTSLSNSRPMRGAILARRRILCNAPSVNLQYDPTTLTCTVLNVDGPSDAAYVGQAELTCFFSATADPIGGLYYKAELTEPVSSTGAGAKSMGETESSPVELFDWISPAGGMGITSIDAGTIKVHAHMGQYGSTLIAGTYSCLVYAEVYTRTSGGVETLVGTSNVLPLTRGTLTEVTFAVPVAAPAACGATDRLVVKFWGTTASPAGAGGSNIYIYVGTGYSSGVNPTSSVAGKPIPTVGGSGPLSGEYRYRVTFTITASGILLSESAWSQPSDPITLVNQFVRLTAIPVSTDANVTGRRLYRTADGGSEYYIVCDIEDNTTTTFDDGASDYDIGLLGVVNDLGAPPGHDASDYLRFMVAWKDRLWASPNLNKDLLYYCGLGKPYAWAEDQVFSIKPVGMDEFGCTGLMARRDELVINKRRAVWKIVGTDETDFQLIQVAEGPGGESFDACLVIRDICYWLGENAFWSYGPEGVKNLSRDQVHPWFATDDFFNRARFRFAFANYDPSSDTISLHLAAAGSSVENRWVSYDIRSGIWLGPHKTDAFTPTCAALVENTAGNQIPVKGSSSGSMYWEGGRDADDDGTAIDFEVTAKFHSGEAPDRSHYWGELAMLSKIQTAGTLSIIPYVGGLDATAGATISHNMTTGRERLRRLGIGRLCGLKFKENTAGVQVEIYGYEIPVHELGRR